MEGTTFGDVPLNLELKLEVWDSPNSAGVVIDAVRCCKLGLDHGLKGALIGPSAYFKKSPPQQFPDDIAREMTEAFIRDPRVEHRTAGRAGRAGGTGTARNGPGRLNGKPRKAARAKGGRRARRTARSG
jgi:hypothetical protein